MIHYLFVHNVGIHSIGILLEKMEAKQGCWNSTSSTSMPLVSNSPSRSFDSGCVIYPKASFFNSL